ncbi:hypothetical protein M1D88_18700 [Arthrobacter sp. R1-13]
MQHEQAPDAGQGAQQTPQSFEGRGQLPIAGQSPAQYPDQQPLSWGQFRYHMQGLQHARDGLVLAVIGIVFLGIVFGPLALAQAKKAEAYGINAQNTKVVAWVAIGWFCAQLIFLVLYFAFFLFFIWQAYSQRIGR